MKHGEINFSYAFGCLEAIAFLADTITEDKLGHIYDIFQF